MEQLRQVGEAIGAINALMVFSHELRINPRQCRLLADACALAFDAVAGEVRAHLRFDERLAKWKPLEGPLRELHRAVRDAEHYIRLCLEPPLDGWWARAAAATHGVECVEHHLHGILWCVAVVLEAVEAVGEVTGSDPDEIARRRLLLARDYDDKDLLDPTLFRRSRIGKAYLATQELAARMDMAWKEDRWLLSQQLDEMKGGGSSKPPLSRHEQRLADVLASPRGKVHPASVLLADFHMRRRLGGSLKEVQWMGEPFAVKHYVGFDATTAGGGEEIALLTTVAHPNVAHCRYCFHDEEKRELFLVMDQLMSKDLGCYLKEVTCAKRRVPFPLVVAVDVMLQIARGMEHLHANNIYHGDLNPSNVLLKPRHADAYLIVKVAGLGQSGVSVGSPGRKAPATATATNTNNANPCIWYAPEVLGHEGDDGQAAAAAAAAKCTEKADVYSFGMICFELLTGKIPFEDNHLQGDKTSKNIRAGERPLFPFQAPKYLTSLTKRCWHCEPAQRPAFHSICRILRYVKRFLVMNPEAQASGQPDAPPPMPSVDYLDLEALLLRKFPAWQQPPRVTDVPFQMYAYRVMEKERTKAATPRHTNKIGSDSSSDGNSLFGDDSGGLHLPPEIDTPSTVLSRGTTTARSPSRRSGSGSTSTSTSTSTRIASPRYGQAMSTAMAGQPGPPKKSKSMGVVRPPQTQTSRRMPRIGSDGQLQAAVIPSSRRRKSVVHGSDSELGQ